MSNRPEKTRDLITIGEPMGEFNATRGGGDHFQFGYGGDACNCAVAAARQGAKVAMWTALGDDETGQTFRELWAREGIDGSLTPSVPGGSTGLYFVTHGPKGHVFSYRRAGSAASLVTPADVPQEEIARARVIHASGISQAISNSACDAVFTAFETARQHGTLISYDTNLRLKLWPLTRARAIIEETAGMADIVRPSVDDAILLCGQSDPDAIADHYLRKGARIVALTLGSEGCLIATPDKRQRFAPITVSPLDATGAGDTFDGSFIAELIRTQDPFKAGAYANVAAALSTQGYGAIDPIPTRAQVEARMADLS